MNHIDIQEKNINTALFQFIFPFSFKDESEQKIFPFLKTHGFKHFRLDHLEDESRYYGRYQVSHRDMEAFYLPFTNKILFPNSEQEKGIQRYSKSLNVNAFLKTSLVHIPFQVNSIDVTLCPYELGFLTIRVSLQEAQQLYLSQALEFATRFRVLSPRTTSDQQTEIEVDETVYNKVEDFVFDYLFNGLTEFFEKKHINGATFETFPFFEDGRMYIQSLLALHEDQPIDEVDVYRSIGLCGLTPDGKPYISANNLSYIKDYLGRHCFSRWGPTTYFTMEEHSFICLTNEKTHTVSQLASQVYGEYYYSLILNLFHKIVLLKIAHAYAEINIEQDTNEMEKLIYSINSFTANYFFSELASQSQGRDIFYHLRKTFNIELLYKDAKETLNSLFKYQENSNAKKDSLLLLILTLYSVIGQMLGMNFVLDDLVGKIKWQHMLSYNPIEYLALFVGASGILVSLYLGIKSLYQWIQDRKSRKKWVEKTVMSSTKEKY